MEVDVGEYEHQEEYGFGRYEKTYDHSVIRHRDFS
jgi:hypothetical protein